MPHLMRRGAAHVNLTKRRVGVLIVNDGATDEVPEHWNRRLADPFSAACIATRRAAAGHLGCGQAAREGLAEDGESLLVRAPAPGFSGLSRGGSRLSAWSRRSSGLIRARAANVAKRCAAWSRRPARSWKRSRPPQVLDAALIAGAQKVEHYEIAAHGSVRALAEACGRRVVAQLMDETLEEEKEADRKPNQIALSEVNRAALEAAA
jgi:Domain of unknown function (DUF892)